MNEKSLKNLSLTIKLHAFRFLHIMDFQSESILEISGSIATSLALVVDPE